jgi:hypothetical protein
MRDERWELLSAGLSASARADKRQFLSGLDRLNRIRNCVMHPVRGTPPTGEDFAFLGDFWKFVSSDHETR